MVTKADDCPNHCIVLYVVQEMNTHILQVLMQSMLSVLCMSYSIFALIGACAYISTGGRPVPNNEMHLIAMSA